MISCAVAAILSGCAGAAAAADPGSAPAAAVAPSPAAADSSSGTGVEEVLVTAQRRSETLEHVPMTVQAFTGQVLAAQNVTTLDNLLRFTPNVSYGNNGPGQGNIFMRGLSAGFAGNQSSATAGNFPNVAIYLDDESMQFPARNVDIYVVDMERVEVLEGPQGALFGGGAEAGALRYITNKPKLNVFEGNAEAGYGTTAHGDPNSSFNVTVNLPLLKDKLAVRAVFYDERQGGYIDNVPSTFTRMNSDLGNAYFNIKPTAGLCPNHLPAGPAGLCSPPNSGPINNSAIAANAQNPTTYQGGRVSALYNINNDWDLLIQESFQQLDADGLSADYPIGSDGQLLKPLQVTSFNPSYDKDSYANTAWTLTGKIGDLKAVYTGGYLLRNIKQQMEYTNYSRTSGGMYYQCTGGSTGFGSGPGSCYSPNGYWQDTVRNTHLTQEVRLSTPDDWRLRAIGGAYYEDFRIYDDQNFNYKTIPACDPANLAAALAGGPVCVADVTTLPGVPTNHPGIRSDNTAFGEDAQRGYDQFALFTSIDYDIIPQVLTVTGGTRYFEYSENEFGTQYATVTSCVNIANGQCPAGLTDIGGGHDKKVYHGFKSRANITWHITPDLMTYLTFSQGFRPGGFNRSISGVAKDANGVPQFEKPNSYAPDSLDNYEVGLKSELFDHRLQLNVSAYYMQWHDVQFLFFNPVDLGNTTFGVNGPSYNIYGLEAQFVGRVTEGLTVQGSLSYNDDEQYTSPCLTDNISTSPTFGKCITEVKGAPFANPFGSLGSTPAFSPRFQGNIRARYDWTIDDYKAFSTLGASYTGDMFNQPATYQSGAGVTIPTTTYLRYLQPGYVTLDGSVGVNIKNYTISVYGSNLFDSHASTFTSSAQFIKSEVPLRPRVIMAKIAAKF